MKRKSFAIIGGGYSGCSAALYLVSKGQNVTIYENKSLLGGVAKDLLYNDSIYFNGPIYLDTKSLLIKLLQKEKFFKKHIKTCNLSYGSYTDIFGEENVSNNIAHPVSSSKFETKNNLSFKLKSLKDRIEYYPTTVRENLTLWSAKYEHILSNLHHDMATVMGFSRLHFKNCNKEISKLKKKSKIADDLLGIPDLNYNKIKFCIPKNGYNSFFESIKYFLKKKKVKVNLSCRVTIKKEAGKLTFLSENKKINADYFIWASNPVPLIFNLGLGVLDNPIFKVQIISCELNNQSKKIENRYIQVFSKKSNIFRIYFYNLLDKNKIAIELLHNKKRNSIENELIFARKILSKFKYKLSFKNPINTSKQIRHILFTVNDYNKFMEFQKISKKYNIIGGAWYVIGSDNKMDHIKNEIDKLDI